MSNPTHTLARDTFRPVLWCGEPLTRWLQPYKQLYPKRGCRGEGLVVGFAGGHAQCVCIFSRRV